MNHHKPFSQACENNKTFILEHLKRAFSSRKQVLEIGSGTGQHAVFFASGLPHLIWQTSDQPHYLPGINLWIDDFPRPNLRRPIPLTFGKESHSFTDFDGIFTANTAHIMQKEEVESMMKVIADSLPEEGVFCQYGPFTTNGQFSSDSNKAFHMQLLEQGYGGYRDISELTLWATGLQLTETIAMPANNLLLVWVKQD